MKKQRTKQLEMKLTTWGGKRKGAGRKPKGKKAGVPHRTRPALATRFPVHVTLKVKRTYRGLRNKKRLAVVRRAFVGAQRKGFRITDWSLQGDHIHVICEAHDAKMLSSGVKSFSGRVAKGLNKLLDLKGSVFADRYHSHILKTPREVRNALSYVLLNARHHGITVSDVGGDLFSSAQWFDGWQGRRRFEMPNDDAPVRRPSTWLRRVGWRRHGLIELTETPGSRRR